MYVESLSEGDAEAYDAYLRSEPSTLVYQSTRYRSFLTDLLDCSDATLVTRKGSEIRGALPLLCMTHKDRRVYNSMPFFGGNGSIIASSPEAADGLMDAYRDLISPEDVLASTIVENPFDGPPPAAYPHNYTDRRIAQYTAIEYSNNRREQLMAAFDGTARRNVRKAEREGFEIEKDPSELDRLREIHQENMRAKGGNPKSDTFFTLIPEHFRAGHDYDLYVARLDGQMVAGLLVFYFNQTVEYYTPAIAHDYRSLQPSALLILRAMIDASRQGYTRWNWGGTWESQTGVYRFKKKWDAQETYYHYYTQLNDERLLDWSRKEIQEAFPGFYLVPFSALNEPQPA